MEFCIMCIAVVTILLLGLVCLIGFSKLISKPDRCSRCGRKLTGEEKEYYGSFCEKCEHKWMKDIMR